MSNKTISFNEAKSPTLLLHSVHLNSTLARIGRARLRSGNKATLLINGKETYEDWLNAIDNAKKWIHLENYIFQSDTIGKKFAEALIKKSQEGVKVKVLYDWFGCISTPKSFWNHMRKFGVEVRVVSPLSFLSLHRIFRRDHRKFLGVDGIYGSLGGVCIGDQWLENSPATQLPYRDTAVSITGPAVVDLEAAFAKLWDKMGKESLSTDERISDLSFPQVNGEDAVRVISQEPGKMRILKVLELMIQGAEKRLWIADAYFLAVPSLYQALINAAKDGVDVRILLPSTNDIPWVAALSRTGYRQLLEAGVRIWEYSGLMMHSKTTVIDGWWSRIGSTNLNISSLLLNWELDLIIEDRNFSQKMEKVYERDLKDAIEICLFKKDRNKIRAQRTSTNLEKKANKTKLKTTSGSSRFVSTAARIGTAALASSGKALLMHEKKIGAFVSSLSILLSTVIFFFPRIFAWPFSLVFLLLGIAGFVRTFQRVR